MECASEHHLNSSFRPGAAEGLGININLAKLWAGPELGLVSTPEIIILGLWNGMVFVGQIVECETPRDCLLVERIGFSRQRVRLIGLCLAFRADDMLDAGKLQQVAKLSRVEDIRRLDHDKVAARLVGQRYGAYAIAVLLDRNRSVAQQHS
jgi:hypothetical protein